VSFVLLRRLPTVVRLDIQRNEEIDNNTESGGYQLNTSQPVCLYCQRDRDQVPLLTLQYRGSELWICPQHLPILIHKPAQLAEILPGAENMGSSESHDHH
jgi:hypothetical protein